MYKIIDKTKEKNLDFKLAEKEGVIAADIVGSGREIEGGDMFWIRDALIKMGYVLWKDFSIQKIDD